MWRNPAVIAATPVSTSELGGVLRSVFDPSPSCAHTCTLRAHVHTVCTSMIRITCHIKPRHTAGDTGMCSHCGTQPASIHTTLLFIVHAHTQYRQARIQSAMVTSRHRSQQQHMHCARFLVCASCTPRIMHTDTNTCVKVMPCLAIIIPTPAANASSSRQCTRVKLSSSDCSHTRQHIGAGRRVSIRV